MKTTNTCNTKPNKTKARFRSPFTPSGQKMYPVNLQLPFTELLHNKSYVWYVKTVFLQMQQDWQSRYINFFEPVGRPSLVSNYNRVIKYNKKWAS